MRTVYQSDLTFDDEYVSNYTTNTQNSKGMYVLLPEFNANSAMFDSTANNDSYGGSVLEGS